MTTQGETLNGDYHHHHKHNHGGIFGEQTELIFSIISGLMLGIGFLLSFINTIDTWISVLLYVSAYFFGGYFTTKEAYNTMKKGGFEIDFLMLLAAIGAAILGQWAEGALLLFLFSLGHALEHFALNKAENSIAALARLTPKTAIVRKGNRQVEVPIDQLKVGETIIVKPNSIIAADGLVVKGKSSVNQAPITGESIPVDKQPANDDSLAFDQLAPSHQVFAGTINGAQVLEVKVLKKARDTTLARLIELVNVAKEQKSPTQHFTDKFEKYYVPAILVIVILLLFAFLVIDEPFSESFYRAITVLVAASPCALAIATPSAVLSGVARAAKAGILIKGGGPLETLGQVKTIAVDKTGTLTKGEPRLTDVIPYQDITRKEILTTVLAVEQLSDHPLAKAVVQGALSELKDQPKEQAHALQAFNGRGVQAIYQNCKVFIGNRSLFEEELSLSLPAELAERLIELEATGTTAMVIRKGEQYLGIIGLIDQPRPESHAVIRQLQEIGIKRIAMLTGDNQQVANRIAAEIGINDVYGSLLPEDKVTIINQLKEQEDKVAMIGDGVNDAPAMTNSSVSIAMGAAGSDVALETADIALMADHLKALPFAMQLSRKSKAIIKQNLWLSLAVTALLIPASIFNFAGIGIVVLIHEGSTIAVVFNALRLLAYQVDEKLPV
ncbi:heavy metal translocating P-type ATPase [Amphibacillus sediminis]|uniref:heavy metal translocating P-type ATPase n=1 Tax=Amphibacillus sediminis TaxID=360185 RepID=UPI000832B21B|nr:heavy metal translocating P-type ATPase [Amphibacillus sediminis]